MSEASEKLNEAGKLKRAIIDHMVITMVAGVVSCFFFLVWHLYSTLERRVTEHDRESSAAIMVLKEAVINYKVRLDMLEREGPRKPETAAVAPPAPNPIASAEQVKLWEDAARIQSAERHIGVPRIGVPILSGVSPKPEEHWSAAPRTGPPQQQQQQQQQTAPPPMIRQIRPLEEFEMAREELRKKINEAKPSSKP